MTYPSASTPNPSVHYAAGSDLNQLAFAGGELEAIGQKLLQGFLHQVVLGLLGAANPQADLAALKAQLSSWAQGLDASAVHFVSGLYDASVGFANQALSVLRNLNGTGLYDASVGFGNQASSVLQHLGTGASLGLYDASQGFANQSSSLLKYLGTGANLGLYDASQGFANLSSSLLKNITASGANLGQFAASGVSGVLSNATIAGADVTGALNTAVTIAGQTVATVQANAQGTIDAIVQAAQNDAGLVNQALTDAHANLVSFFSGLNAAFTGGNTASPPPASAADAVAAAGTIQERLAIIGNGAKEQINVDFSTYSNGPLPANFTVFDGSGNISINGGVAQVTGTYGSTTGFADVGYAGASLTDYQVVTAKFPIVSGAHAVALIYGRMSGAGETRIQAYNQGGAGGWELASWINIPGGTKVFDVSFADTFDPTATYQLVCGDAESADLYKFQILKNGAPLSLQSVTVGDTSQPAGQLYYEDTGHGSAVGGSFRGGGFGMTTGLVTGDTGTVTMSNFGLEDTAPSSPGVLVTTSESTSSTTYTDLATVSDEVAVNIGDSGNAIVTLSANVANGTSTGDSFMGFAMSGANTASASDDSALMYQAWAAGAQGTLGIAIPLSGLNSGLTVFKAKYRTSGSTGTFANRRIGVLAL